MLEIPDMKNKKAYWNGIVEETLTKRPYAKYVAIMMLEAGVIPGSTEGDCVRLAKECFKNLSSEDLNQMKNICTLQTQTMQDFEVKYPASIAKGFGPSASQTLANELAKLM